MAQEEDKLVIRRLNDEFRQTGRGGRIMMTNGIKRLGSEAVDRIMAQVRAFSAFKEGNDPYGEHDFGSLTAEGERIFWKIDYYGKGLDAHSPDPADPAVTIRILTVMLAEEY
jgi:hypothetical protein